MTRHRSVQVVLVVALMIMGLATAGAAAPVARHSYIVVFEPGIASPAAAAAQLAGKHGGDVGFVYEHAIQGFSIVASERAAVAIARNPQVAYVELDRAVTLQAQETPTGIDRIFATGNSNLDIDGTDDFRVDVDVAVIDTGVDFQHPDLNVVGGVNCASGGPFGGSCSSGGDDDHYHGTHVAGTIGAIDDGNGVVGVAPGARIWAVKVLSKRGSGYTSWIVAGIDWVAANADTIEVANMSLGGRGFSQAEYDAIQGAVEAGVAFAVAAGNDADYASNYSPAAFDNALTVSALADFDGAPGGNGSKTCRTDEDDTLANFSNFGSAVDITAPGVCILSTFPLEQGSYGTISGTSMASPHVAGALALLASVDNPADAADVHALYDQVINGGNFNWTDDSGDGIREALLDVTGFSAELIGNGGNGGNTPPTVTIANPADGTIFEAGASITFGGSAADNEDGDLTGALVWRSSLDHQIGTGGSFTVVLSEGTHEITASLTDSGGLSGADTISLTVNGASTGGITLSVTAYKVRGVQHADLTWSGASSANVDVYRSGTAEVSTTANDGFYTDSTGVKGGGSASYQICESGTSTCSSTVDVTW